MLAGPAEPKQLAVAIDPTGGATGLVRRDRCRRWLAITPSPAKIGRITIMSSPVVKLAPSILAADFARLGEQVRRPNRPGPTASTSMSWTAISCPTSAWGRWSSRRCGPSRNCRWKFTLMIEQPDTLSRRLRRGRRRFAAGPRRERGQSASHGAAHQGAGQESRRRAQSRDSARRRGRDFA